MTVVQEKRINWFVAATFFIVALVLYAAFRSRYAYHWDSAEFVLAVNDYSVKLSQPHAPGYFLYVWAARLVNTLVGDPHRSLQWLSVVAGAGLVALMYAVGTALFGRWVGVGGALFTLTSPQVWFHGAVALTYVVDAFLIVLMVGWCWRAMARGGTWTDVIGIAVIAALAGGVRPQSLPALLPLAIFAVWHFRAPRLWKAVVGVSLTIGLVTMWFVPMVEMSGGWSVYADVVARHRRLNAPTTLVGGGWRALERNILFAGVFCWNGLVLAAGVLLAGLFHRTFRMSRDQKQAWDKTHQQALRVVALWALPMIALGIVGVTNQPGYILSYLPALLLLAAVVIAQLRSVKIRITVIALVVGANVVVFLGPLAPTNAIFFGVNRCAGELRNHDQQLERLVKTIREQYSPQKAYVCHGNWSALYGLRHLQIYLPEFEQCQLLYDFTMLSPPGRPLMAVVDGKLTYTTQAEALAKPGLLLVVPPSMTLDIFAPYLSLDGVEPVPGTDGILYELRRKESS